MVVIWPSTWSTSSELVASTTIEFSEPYPVMAWRTAQLAAEPKALDLLPVEPEPLGVVVQAPHAVPAAGGVRIDIEPGRQLLTQRAHQCAVHQILDLVPVEGV
jgi:hypothetical protein